MTGTSRQAAPASQALMGPTAFTRTTRRRNTVALLSAAGCGIGRPESGRNRGSKSAPTHSGLFSVPMLLPAHPGDLSKQRRLVGLGEGSGRGLVFFRPGPDAFELEPSEIIV